MAEIKDRRPVLEKAIGLLDDSRGNMRGRAAAVIGSLALEGISDPKCLPRLFQLLGDAEAKDNATYALRVMADRGFFRPSAEEREALGDWGAPEICPYCDHDGIMEVFCYENRTDEETVPTPELVDYRPLVYLTSYCTYCHHSLPVDKVDWGWDTRCVKCGKEARWWMEYRFHYKGVKNRGYNSLQYKWKEKKERREVFGPNFCYLFWQCMRCLKTWSQESIDNLPKDCPRCGMRTLTYVVPTGHHEYPRASEMAASERNEVIVDGMSEVSSWLCAECGYSTLDSGDESRN